jgi:hypothetical protein
MGCSFCLTRQGRGPSLRGANGSRLSRDPVARNDDLMRNPAMRIARDYGLRLAALAALEAGLYASRSRTQSIGYGNPSS